MSCTQAVHLNVFLERDELDSSSGIGYDPRKGLVGLNQGHWILPTMGTTGTHPRTLDMTQEEYDRDTSNDIRCDYSWG
jgi:hypothetical protein